MKQNFFTAALESEVPDTVTIDEVTELSTLQPKVGVGEKKGGEPSEDKVTKEFGEDSLIAEHDEIDTVAESQEHTLALEHLQSTCMRFCRMAAALEEIAETAENNLEEGTPMDPATVEMVSTAIDAGGIGGPMKEAVALESFGFDTKVATEGFIDAIKERAEKIWTAVSKFVKKTLDITSQKLKRFADYFRRFSTTYALLEKEGEILNGYSGKPFQNAKWEKDIQERIYAPSSTKTPVQAVDNAHSEYDEVMNLVENKLFGEMRALSNSWATDNPTQVVAAMNKCLSIARSLQEMGETRFKHSSTIVEVNLPERITLEGTAGLEGTQITYGEGRNDFSAGIRTASMADIKHLKESAIKAERSYSAAWDSFRDMDFEPKYKWRAAYDEDDAGVARKLLSKYANLMRVLADLAGGCVFGSADGFFTNHFAATRWVRFSISEAKAAAREAGTAKK